MVNYNRLAGGLKRGLGEFLQNISEKFKRPVMKFILQMLYDIFAGNKVHLSEIARCL